MSTVSDNLIEGNLIGTDPTGTSAQPNATLPMGTNVKLGFGIGLAGATGITIGGTSAAAHNVISGNAGVGIVMSAYIADLSDYDPSSGTQLATTGNLAIGNYIGVDTTGSALLGNVTGVIMEDAASNTLGGTAAAALNVISGNIDSGSDAVGIIGSAATDDVVLGDFIGTDSTGSMAIADYGGVFVGDVETYNAYPFTAATGTASDATIGGTAAGAGNLVASNLHDGIDIDGTSGMGNESAGDLVAGNTVGGALERGRKRLQWYSYPVHDRSACRWKFHWAQHHPRYPS